MVVNTDGLADLARLISNMCDHKNKPVALMTSWIVEKGAMQRATAGTIEQCLTHVASLGRREAEKAFA